MKNVRLSCIVAMAHNNVIGVKNDLPWHIPEDLKRFKALTTGKPVIMGRKTFESIYERLGKPLPGRPNIVISRSQEFNYEHVHMAKTVEDAIEAGNKIANDLGVSEIFCIGGAEIYKQTITYCERIYLTFVDANINGDAYFPAFDESLYRLIEDIPSEITTDEGDTLKYSFRTYERQKT